MKTQDARKYNCKDEELAVICGYAAFSLKRDLNEFIAFSPKMDQTYVDSFETKIEAVNEILSPQLETAELKIITSRLYATMDGLINPLNRVGGYLTLAKKNVPISAKDFGLTALRKKANTKDAEGVLQEIKIVQANLAKYKTSLAEQGLTDDLIDSFGNAATSIAEDNQKQYEIVSARKTNAQQNVSLFNELHAQLMEICDIGKILYKDTDALKLQEYTFAELKKKVRATT